jgi:DNA-directed RNA polymerase subunit RPC12/RpoP
MIVLNEKKYAIECLENGFVGKKPFFTLSIIAKYYYHSLGYRKSKINHLLNEFMSKHYAGYHLDKLSWQDTIEGIVKKVNKYSLLEVDGVSITQSELRTISEIGNPTKERVMFTILCLAKFGLARNPNSNGWVNTDSKEIFKMARVSCKALERELYIGDLFDRGLLELPMRNDNTSIRVTFIDTDSLEELFVSDFRELGYEYLKYKGENFIRCADCGILTRGNKNGTKRYCKDCSAYTPKETKTLVCVDCGKEFQTKSKNSRSIRCIDCQHKKQLEYQRISMMKLRNVK